MLAKISGEILGHPLGQRGDEHALPKLHTTRNLGEQVIDLGAYRPDLDLRIDQPRGPHELLDHLRGMQTFIVPGRRRHEDHLRRHALPFLETQRSVVERRGQPEPVLDQCLFARAVACIHSAELRQRLMALIDHQQRAVGQVVIETRRRLAGLAP